MSLRPNRERGRRPKHELNVLFGERDAELKALTEQIEDCACRPSTTEAERVLAQEAEARKSVQNLSEDLMDHSAEVDALEAAIMRAEGQLGAVNEQLAELRGSIPA